MFSRAFWLSTEVTWNCKSSLVKWQSLNNPVRSTQVRYAFQSGRGSRRIALKPDVFDSFVLSSRNVRAQSLVKPLLFTLGVSAASVAVCSIWQYESLRSRANAFIHKKTEKTWLEKWWSSLRENEKVFFPILAANILVFGAWRVRLFQPFMMKYFCSNPAGSAVYLPMVLSTFSHYALLHLAANMYVLYSFMPAVVATMGKEQFVAMYLTGGVVSSFASFLYKAAVNQPGLSLGASGAIMAVLSYVCVQYPDTKLSIILLPMYTFAAGTAIKVIMGIDFAGVVLGWRFFDHAAHLGGALLGIGWCFWGGQHIWGNRDKFLKYYHDLRERDAKR